MPDAALVKLASGKQLHVQERGNRDGPAVIFLHGLGSRSEFWGAALDALSLDDSHRLVCFDFDGSGRSPLSGELSIDSLADDAIALLDALHIQRATLVGHSMSGLVVTTAAVRHPDRVDRVVSVGGIRAPTEAGVKVMSDRADKARSQGMAGLATAVASGAISKRSLAQNRLAFHFVRTLVGASNPDGYAAACLAITRAVDPDYSRIEVPGLIVGGAEDAMATPDTLKSVAQAIGDNARHVSLPEVGHWPTLEDPQAIADALRPFLAEK